MNKPSRSSCSSVMSSDNDIDQSARHHNYLLDIIPGDEFPDLIALQRKTFNYCRFRIPGNAYLPAQFAVDLNYQFNFILHQRGTVGLRPGLIEEFHARLELPPQCMTNMRNNGR